MSALLLPGQAAAPEGPIDLSMMYVLHHGFRRDLARFADAVRLTPVSDGVTWTALLQRWDLFAMLLHDHHHKEDDHVWPLLRRAAGGDTAGLAVLDEMEAEHDTIDPLLDGVREGLARMTATPDAATKQALVRLVVGARDTLDAHLGHEERDAITLLQRYVESGRVEAPRPHGAARRPRTAGHAVAHPLVGAGAAHRRRRPAAARGAAVPVVPAPRAPAVHAPRARGLLSRPRRGRCVRGVRSVGDRDFADVVLGSGVPVLVAFHATGSASCRGIGTELDAPGRRAPRRGGDPARCAREPGDGRGVRGHGPADLRRLPPGRGRADDRRRPPTARAARPAADRDRTLSRRSAARARRCVAPGREPPLPDEVPRAPRVGGPPPRRRPGRRLRGRGRRRPVRSASPSRPSTCGRRTAERADRRPRRARGSSRPRPTSSAMQALSRLMKDDPARSMPLRSWSSRARSRSPARRATTVATGPAGIPEESTKVRM